MYGIIYHVKVTEVLYKFLKKNEESAVHWYCSKCNTGVGKVTKNMIKISKWQDEIKKCLDELEDKTYERLGRVKEN